VIEEEIQCTVGLYSETPIILPERMTARDIGILWMSAKARFQA